MSRSPDLARLKDLFLTGRELTPNERPHFIKRECADDAELRERLEGLLAADAMSEGLLEPQPGAERARPAAPEYEAGHLLNGRYRLESQLGEGGFGTAYLARDERLNDRRVVVKVQHLSDAGGMTDGEVAALSRLRHPGIVGIHDVGITESGERFMVLEYSAGRTLRTAIASRESFLAPRVAGLARQLGAALDAAHLAGVWHLDVKPENIMLEGYADTEVLRIIDFGIAASDGAGGVGKGSPAYMAPEHIAGMPGAASDVYSMAMVLFEVATGARPRAGEDPFGQLASQRPEWPITARQLLAKALNDDPAKRPVSAGDLGDRLALCLTGSGRGWRIPVATGLIAVSLLASVAVVLQWKSRRQDEEAKSIQNTVNSIRRVVTDTSVSPDKVLPLLQSEVARLRMMIARGDTGPSVREALMLALVHFGSSAGNPGGRNLGQLTEAVAAYREAVELVDGLAPGSAKGAELSRVEFRSLLASTLIEQGQYTEAEAVISQAIAIWQRLPPPRESRQDYLRVGAGAQAMYSRILFHDRRLEECRALRQRLVEIRREAHELDPKSSPLAVDYAGGLALSAYTLREMGRIDESLQGYRAADAVLVSLLDADPLNAQYRLLLARNHMEEGRCQMEAGRFRAAAGILYQGERIFRALHGQAPDEVAGIRDLALTLSLLAEAQAYSGARREAVEGLAAEATSLAERAAGISVGSVKAQEDRETVQRRVARAQGALLSRKIAEKKNRVFSN